MQTANMAGMLVGSFLCGILSDKVGRKPTLMLSLAPLLLGGCLPLSFPSNPDFYPLLVLARFISGFGAVGAFIMALCLSLEYVGASYRVLFGILIQVVFHDIQCLQFYFRIQIVSDVGAIHCWRSAGWVCLMVGCKGLEAADVLPVYT